MTEELLGLVAGWGLPAILMVTFLSCLALPVPASIVMLAGGAFAASGDLPLLATVAAALAGAVAGDQTGYMIGRAGAGRIGRWVEGAPSRAAVFGRARTLIDSRGGIGVFLSRWLFSPLGPYANFVAGMAPMDWRRFTVFGVAGEAVWVALYVGVGYTSAASLDAAADAIGNALGAIAAGALALALGWWLLRSAGTHRAGRHRATGAGSGGGTPE